MQNIRSWSFPLILTVGFFALLPTGCGGPRIVHDEWGPGVPKRHGTVINNEQTGEWNYWYTTGAKEATGSWAHDKQDGSWTWWYPDGRIKQSGYYQGQGIDLSNRSSSPRMGTWRYWHDNGRLKSMGAYDNDRQTGAWSYFTQAGEPHATGFYNNGVKDGAWTWWHENGQVKVSGRFSNGMKVALWRAWDEKGQVQSEVSYTVDGKAIVLPPPPVVTITAPPPALPPNETSLVAVAPPIVAVVVTEQTDAVVVPAADPATNKVVSKPTESDNVAPTAIPLSPTVSVPTIWTTNQEANAAKLIRKYTTGVQAPGEVYDAKSFGGEGDRQRQDLLGRPLPQTRFLSAAGNALDIDEMCKKGPVLVVILRGFSGQVCLYCAAQTTAISKAIQRFEKSNIQVVVVYPGPVDAIPSFLQAVRSLANDPPPMPVALDVSLIAVRALGIDDNLAKPTSLIIDTKGQIRYAYVGKTIADRPSVEELLTVGHRLAQERK